MIGRAAALVLLAALPTALAFAQPVLNPNGIVNAASFLPPDVPGGAIARGSIFSIFGQALASASDQTDRFPLPTELGGVRVEILTADSRTLSAPLLYVSPTQINAILPSDTPIGPQRLRVISNGSAGAPVAFKAVQSSAGLFTEDNAGFRQPAGIELLTGVRAGDRITLWLTGLGPIESSDAAAPPAGDVPTRLSVVVGGQPAQIEYQGRSTCCAGLDQVNLIVPSDAPTGCFVPLWLEVNQDLYSNIATISISPPGRECWETDSTLAAPTGQAPMARLELNNLATANGSEEDYRAFLINGSPSLPSFPNDDPAALPPPGLCRPWISKPDSRPAFNMEFVVQGPAGDMALSPFESQPNNLVASPPLGLPPGPYNVYGLGGPDFATFTASLTIPPSPIWSNTEFAGTEREQGLTENWTGGDPDAAGVVLISPQERSAPSELLHPFVCRAMFSDGALSVPPAFTANIPTALLGTEFTSMPSPAEMEFDGPQEGLVVARDTQYRVRHIGAPHLASSPVSLPNGDEIQAELATSSTERQRGLMSRPSMPSDHGMLFFFEVAAAYRFWMYQTLIPLDIIWLDSSRRVIYISSDTPPCPPALAGVCPTYGPDQPAQFVLELNAGEASRRSLSIGDQLNW